MNNNQSTGIKDLFKQKNDETFASRLHHFIACRFVGSPKDLDVPGDFWLDDDCRTPPSPSDYDKSSVAGKILEVETFRRSLRWKLARVAPMFFFIACAGVWITGQGLAFGIQKANEGIEKARGAAQVIEARMKSDTVVSANDMRDFSNDQIIDEMKASLKARGISLQNLVSKDYEPSPRERSLIAEMNNRGIRPEELRDDE